MRTRLTAIIILGIAILGSFEFYSCRKVDHQQETPGVDQPAGDNDATVTATVTGMVYDQTNNPIAGATVRSGSHTTTTNAAGSFSFSNAVVKTRAVITVEKTGFFRSIHTVLATNNGSYSMRFQMIKKTSVYNFNGQTGGTIMFGSGASLVFPANSITDINGNPYTGTVSIACYSFNPSSKTFTDIMPGELLGINAAGQERGLRSYAMIAVEMAGSAGQELKITPGKSVTVNFAIPSSFQASAPQTIPLWYFNDSTGLWKEEGMATKSGTKYTGTVQHFSYWNCDEPFPVIPFKVTFKMADSTPIAFAKIEFRGTGPDSSLFGFGYTNANGYATGLIPAGKILTIKVSAPPCIPVAYSTTIGPFNSPVNLGTIITAAVPPSSVFSVSGVIKDCYNQPLRSGSVVITGPGFGKTVPIVNGNFNLSLLTCFSGTFRTAFEVMDSIGSTIQRDSLTLTSGIPFTHNTTACLLYTNVVINGTYGTSWTNSHPVFTFTSGYNTSNGKTEIYSRWGSFVGWFSDLKLVINANTGSTGSFVLDSFKTHMDPGIPKAYIGSNMTATITEYGPPGGFIRGSYSGSVVDSATGATAQAAGTFFVKRNY